MYRFVCNPFSRLLQAALVLVLLGPGLVLRCRSHLPEHKPTDTMNLLGRWKKITNSDCSAYYPALIDFKTNGLYSAESDPQAAVHPVWDVGTFSLDNDRVSLSTSNDAVVAYKASQVNEQLTFQAPDGCKITYRKL